VWSQDAEYSPQLRFISDTQFLFMLCVTLQRPKSAGSVRLASPDPGTQPVIDINLLAEKSDVARMADGVRRAWALLTSSPIAELTEEILGPAPLLQSGTGGEPEIHGVSDRDLEVNAASSSKDLKGLGF